MGEVMVKTNNQMITLTVDGILTREDAVALVAEFYPTLSGRGCLWDLRQCDVHQLTPRDLEAIALAVVEASASELTPKSAFVVADARAYAKVCAYLARGTRMRARVEAAVFTAEDEARRWIRAA